MRLVGPGKHAAAKCAAELCSAWTARRPSPHEQCHTSVRTQTALTLLTSLSYSMSDSAGSSTQSV